MGVVDRVAARPASWPADPAAASAAAAAVARVVTADAAPAAPAALGSGGGSAQPRAGGYWLAGMTPDHALMISGHDKQGA